MIEVELGDVFKVMVGGVDIEVKLVVKLFLGWGVIGVNFYWLCFNLRVVIWKGCMDKLMVLLVRLVVMIDGVIWVCGLLLRGFLSRLILMVEVVLNFRVIVV